MIIKYLSYNSLTVNSQQSTVNSKINISFGIAKFLKKVLLIIFLYLSTQKKKRAKAGIRQKTNARVKVLIFIKGIFFNLYSFINNNNYAFSFNASKMSQRLSKNEIISLFNSFFNYGELGFYHKNYFNHNLIHNLITAINYGFRNRNLKNNFYGESRIRDSFRNNFEGFLFKENLKKYKGE